MLTDLALALSRRPVADADPLRYLGSVAADVATALDVAGVVIVVPAVGWVRGSDDLATLVGEAQHRDGTGPLPTALRTSRTMTVPDLTRVGPPALAAIAAEAGYTGSVAVVLRARGRAVAGMQLLGRPGQPVEAGHVEALAPVLALVGARTSDLLAAVRPVDARPLRIVRPEVPAPRAAVTQRDVSHRERDRAQQPAPGATGAPRIRVGLWEPAPPFVPQPLAESAPELVTEELDEVGTAMLPAQRRRPRHRRAD